MRYLELLICVRWVLFMVHMITCICVLSHLLPVPFFIPKGATVNKINSLYGPNANVSELGLMLSWDRDTPFFCFLMPFPLRWWESWEVHSEHKTTLGHAGFETWPLIRHCRMSNATSVGNLLDFSFIIFIWKSIALSDSFSQIT